MLIDLLPAALQYLLTCFLFSCPTPAPTHTPLNFALRHELGVSDAARLVFSDIPRSSLLDGEAYSVNTRSVTVPRAREQARFFSARMRGRGVQDDLEWDDTDVIGPNVRDRQTLQMLAKMSNNAYSQPGETDWYDLNPDYNTVRFILDEFLWCGWLTLRTVISVRMGARRRRFSGPYLCDGR